MDDLTPLAAIAIAAAATYASRFIGVLFSGRINVEDPIFEWVTAVAYALLAGLIARMIFLPIGSLEDVPFAIRAGAAAVGLAAFFLTRRNIFAGIGIGTLTLIIATW